MEIGRPGSAIAITRSTYRWRDYLRSYIVEVDGVAAGSVRRGETLTVPVDPGVHRVKAKIDWTGSSELVVDVEEGSTCRFVVTPAGNPFQALAQVFGRKSYLNLSPAELN